MLYSTCCTVVQCIADTGQRFIDVEARWSGSTHDSFILNYSSAKVFFENTLTSTEKGIILGGGDYPIKKWLMIPYLVPNTPNQQGFNTAHKKTRSSVERTFGLMKRRFPIFQGEMHTDPERACQYFGTDAILHNIAVNLRDPHFEEDGNEMDEGHGNAKYVVPQNHRGVVVRDYIANTYF